MHSPPETEDPPPEKNLREERRVASVNRDDLHSFSDSWRCCEAAALSNLSINSEARDTFPAIRVGPRRREPGSPAGGGAFPEGSVGTGSHRIRSSFATIAGNQGRALAPGRSTGRSGAAYFRRSAGSVDAPGLRAGGPWGRLPEYRSAQEKRDCATSA